MPMPIDEPTPTAEPSGTQGGAPAEGTPVTPTAEPTAIDPAKFEDVQKSRDELKAKFRQVQKEADELKVRLSEIDAAKSAQDVEAAKKAGDYETALELMKANAAKDRDALVSQHSKVVIDNALLTAATKAGAIAPEEIALMLKGGLSLDDKTFAPIPDDALFGTFGIATKDEMMKAKSIDALVQEFLEKRPHLRTATSPTGGGGTKPSNPQAKADLSEMSRDERIRYFQDHPEEAAALLAATGKPSLSK